MQAAHDESDQQQTLEAADRVARAVWLWIRCGDGMRKPLDGHGTSQDFIAGVIFGLCHALELDDGHALLSAYIFALIDGDAADALSAARSMARCRNDSVCRDTYAHGLRIAGELVALVSGRAGIRH